MDELVCEATSEADGCAAANLHRNGGITAVVTTLSKESRKERRFMVHEFVVLTDSQAQLCFIPIQQRIASAKVPLTSLSPKTLREFAFTWRQQISDNPRNVSTLVDVMSCFPRLVRFVRLTDLIIFSPWSRCPNVRVQRFRFEILSNSPVGVPDDLMCVGFFVMRQSRGLVCCSSSLGFIVGVVSLLTLEFCDT
jgi:hypothetical protein